MGVIDRDGVIRMMNTFAAKPYAVESPTELFGKKITDLTNST
jgi:hypothetical protein